MASSTQTEERRAIDTTIVDTDVHLRLSRHEIAKYCEEPFASQFSNPNYSPFPSSGWDRTLGDKIEFTTIDGPEDIEENLIRDFGIDHPVINATSLLTRLPQSDVAVAGMRAVNDLLIDQYLDDFPHFFGLATIATQRPQKAAEELDRLGDEKQIVGAYICTTGPREPLGDERFDPIYEAAQDNGLHIAFHGSAGAFMFDFPKQNQGLEKFLSVHTLAHPWSQMLTMTSLLVQGTPVKFPDLNFTFLESGVGWVPYLIYRLNGEYAKRRSEAPLLDKSPEEYVRDQFYFSSQPVGEPNDPNKMNQLLQVLGTENLVFSSDYPHWDFDHPDAFDRHLRSTFSAEEREQVLHGNAEKAFNLSL